MCLLLAVACGGSDANGSGGASGSGGDDDGGGGTTRGGGDGDGAGGSGAAGSSGGGEGDGDVTDTGGSGEGDTGGDDSMAAACSLQIPSGPCSLPGQTCDYAGSPCATVATCVDGQWTQNTVCPSAGTCPGEVPTDGDPCVQGSPVAGPLVCQLGACPEGTLRGPRYQATCNQATWEVRELECLPAVDCGECPPGICCDGFASCPAGATVGRNQCAVGEVCMRMLYAGGDWVWDCAPDNCAPAALACGCVGAVCGQRAFPGDWQCTVVSAPTITCECVGGC